VEKSSAKVKTFKKVSTQEENVCLSAASDEIPSHLVTNELIYQKNIGNEPAAGMTNHMREGMITLQVLAYVRIVSALCCRECLYFLHTCFLFLIMFLNTVINGTHSPGYSVLFNRLTVVGFPVLTFSVC